MSSVFLSFLPAATATLQEMLPSFRLVFYFQGIWAPSKTHNVEDEVAEEERDTRWDRFSRRILLQGMNCSWMCLCVFSSQTLREENSFLLASLRRNLLFFCVAVFCLWFEREEWSWDAKFCKRKDAPEALCLCGSNRRWGGSCRKKAS